MLKSENRDKLLTYLEKYNLLKFITLDRQSLKPLISLGNVAKRTCLTN